MTQYLPNSLDVIGKRIFVAQRHPAAADTNPGTAERPFRTIAAAVRDLEMYDHVYIGGGIYRETVPIRAHGHVYIPESHVHFHAWNGEEVYIRGSDAFAGPWTARGGGVHEAALPESLFAPGAYNPYAVRDDAGLTLGQVYVNGMPYRQVTAPDTAASFMVTADGRTILVNFGALAPAAQAVEITVRQRCFAPRFDGAVLIQTHNICVEHAAEPGPFCKCRPLSIRRSPNGVEVRKEYVLPGPVGNLASIMTAPSYLGVADDTLIAGIVDDTLPVRVQETEAVTATSVDGGRTWRVDPASRRPTATGEPAAYCLDERTGALLKFWYEYPHGSDPRGAFGTIGHQVLFAFSRDGGKSWSPTQVIDRDKKYFFRPCVLADGGYVWPFAWNVPTPDQGQFHQDFGTLLGHWNAAGTDIDWRPGGGVHVEPRESDCGLAEPSVAQFADGRLIAFFRAGATLPSQDHPGVPSVKLFSISADGGRSWDRPRILGDDAGRYVYSPRAYHLAFRCRKNGRVYLALNIAPKPSAGCDPRTHLYLAEIDPATLTVPRDRLILVEAMHPEHYPTVRFSNFQLIEDRATGNPVLFMKLAMSESCPVRRGYDTNLYRYEIVLPD